MRQQQMILGVTLWMTLRRFGVAPAMALALWLPCSGGCRPVSRAVALTRQGETEAGAKAPPQAKQAEPADARECLVEKAVNVDRNENGAPLVVRLKLTYANACRRALACQVIVESGQQPRDENQRATEPGQLRDELRFKFRLAPAQSKKLLGTLWWTKTETTMPVLRWPRLKSRLNWRLLECSYTDQAAAK